MIKLEPYHPAGNDLGVSDTITQGLQIKWPQGQAGTVSRCRKPVLFSSESGQQDM